MPISTQQQYNPHILSVLERKSIVDFLAKKGIKPQKSFGNGKLAYSCPIHQEKTPSFIVWTDAEYQNFHCFGCGRGYTVIHLLSYMENISFTEALSKLSEDLDISPEENISYSIENINKDLLEFRTPFTLLMDLSQKMLSISSLTRLYLEGVNFDPGECGIIDKFWGEFDEEFSQFDFSAVDDTLRYLPQVLKSRREVYENLLIEKKRQEYARR